MEWIQLGIYDAFWSAVVAVGYGVLFSVPRRVLPGCALAGAVGHLVRTVLMSYGLSIEVGTLVGATVVGFVGWELAKRLGAPAIVFTVPGVIPMAPGTFAYRAMLGIIEVAGSPQAEVSNTALWSVSYNATKALLILGALAVGIAAPTLIYRRRTLPTSQEQR